MKDIIKIGVVNFTSEWGNKDVNLKRIVEYCEVAGNEGVNMVVFPETALSGYDNEANKEKKLKMHTRVAETIPGESTERLAIVAQKYHMYIIFGMPEKDSSDATQIYNAAAIIYPDGKTISYRKLHLPFDESDWAVRGEEPVLIETEWGPIGISICYDTYCFPELMRYYRSMGARMCLNVTACPDTPFTRGTAIMTIPTYAFLNSMFIASANLCGMDKESYFIGGSSVIGPDPSGSKARVYVGKMFGEAESDTPTMYTGVIDLSMADKYAVLPIFRKNEWTGERDWRPDLYRQLFAKSEEEYDKIDCKCME